MKNIFFNLPAARIIAPLVSTTLGLLLFGGRAAYAQYTEVESNNDMSTATMIDLGTRPLTDSTPVTISGNSTSSADLDYYRIDTAYTTPGIYRNQIQLNNAAQVVGTLRSFSGTTPGDFTLQGSTRPSATASPYGFNQYYSFGGAGKTQSMYYRAAGADTTTGGGYTATFTSTRITPTALGTFSQGRINLSALANVGTSGVTNTEVFVFDSNYDVYIDNVAGSPTLGYAAMNDNTNLGFNLNRFYSPGTYYIAVGIANVATNDPAPPDENTNSQNQLRLYFDNVIATGSQSYNGNNGNTRPTDFRLTDSTGATVSTSGEQIQSLFALNFYTFNVSSAVVVPESGSVTLFLVGGLSVAGWLCRGKLLRKRAA